MTKTFDLAVFIGRFQPLHTGHVAILKQCLLTAERTVVCVGSARSSRSLRNPLTYAQRVQTFELALSEIPGASAVVDLLPVADSAYNFQEWLIRTKTLVEESAARVFAPRPVDQLKIAVIGHFKDDTSYYLKHFSGWQLVALPSLEDGISSTPLREALFSVACTKDLPEALYNKLPPAVCRYWDDVILPSQEFDQLRKEKRLIDAYKASWAAAPYPPIFVTTDAVVVAQGHVLLIRRGKAPGQGLYALPGGFLEQKESLLTGALRELKEETQIAVAAEDLEQALRSKAVFDAPHRDPRGRVVTHAFYFQLVGQSRPSVAAADDASEAFWFPLHRLAASEELFFGDHALIIQHFLDRL